VVIKHKVSINFSFFNLNNIIKKLLFIIKATVELTTQCYCEI
jgi:hypothetical protein